MPSYLSELRNFYERMIKADDPDMPPAGMTIENISFALVIGENGQLLRTEDLRDSTGKPMRMALPAPVTRSGTKKRANFLWDNTGYALGVDGGNKKSDDKFAAFRQLHEQLLADIPEALPFLRFLKTWKSEMADQLEQKNEIAGENIVFKMEGSGHFLHENPKLMEVWLNTPGRYGEPARGICLVTGKPGLIVPTHPKIKGVQGAQSSGAALVSFNEEAFTSYGKEQNANAPVSEKAAHDYVAALNYLVDKGHEQMARVGDTSILFWADSPVPEEKIFGSFFDSGPAPYAAQDADQVDRIKGILESYRENKHSNNVDKLSSGAQFYVLGLAPNSARISVRFWLTAALDALLSHINQWYEDLEVEREFQDKDPQFPPLWLLLRALSAQDKTSNLPPELGAQLACCVLKGGRFPESVFAAIIQRIHADKRVGYFRAALAKAYLCRNHHGDKSMQTLNEDEKNIGYRLGRVFALLEKAQKDALGQLNAPLRERYIGSASATPRMVFPLLLRLAQHHLSKVRKDRGEGHEINFSRQMAEILSEITDFPATLTLADQGRFMLGYYHQTNALYRKTNAGTARNEEEGNQ